MREGLGIGLGRQPVAPRFEAVPQLAEVLDDAVVDDRDLTRAVLVRMRVEVVRTAVGRPSGVREADRRMWRPVGDRRPQIGQLAGLLLDEQVAAIIDQRDARRVIAPVFEAG